MRPLRQYQRRHRSWESIATEHSQHSLWKAEGCNQRERSLCIREEESDICRPYPYPRLQDQLFERRLPAVHDGTDDRAALSRRYFQHYWSHVLRVEKGHEIECVGVRVRVWFFQSDG